MEVLDIEKWKSNGIKFKYPAIILEKYDNYIVSLLCTYFNNFKDNLSNKKITIYIKQNDKYKLCNDIDFTIENLSKMLRIVDYYKIVVSEDDEFEVRSIKAIIEKLKEI